MRRDEKYGVEKWTQTLDTNPTTKKGNAEIENEFTNKHIEVNCIQAVAFHIFNKS